MTDLAWNYKISIIVALKFGNKDHVSMYSGVKVFFKWKSKEIYLPLEFVEAIVVNIFIKFISCLQTIGQYQSWVLAGKCNEW